MHSGWRSRTVPLLGQRRLIQKHKVKISTFLNSKALFYCVFKQLQITCFITVEEFIHLEYVYFIYVYIYGLNEVFQRLTVHLCSVYNRMPCRSSECQPVWCRWKTVFSLSAIWWCQTQCKLVVLLIFFLYLLYIINGSTFICMRWIHRRQAGCFTWGKMSGLM